MVESADSLAYLRKEHEIIQMVSGMMKAVSVRLAAGDAVSPSDLDKMMTVLENMDKCHRVEEDQVLFQLKVRSHNFDGPIRSLLAEHDSARQIFKNLKTELDKWKADKKSTQLLIKYIQDYAASLGEHVRKEEEVFKSKDVGLLTEEDHRNIVDRFKKVEANVLGTQTKGKMISTIIELQNRYSK